MNVISNLNFFEKIIWKDLEGLGRCSDGDCSKVLKVKMWFLIKIPFYYEEDNLSIHIVRERLRLGSSSSPSEKVWNYFLLHFKCFRHHDNYRHYHHHQSSPKPPSLVPQSHRTSSAAWERWCPRSRSASWRSSTWPAGPCQVLRRTKILYSCLGQRQRQRQRQRLESSSLVFKRLDQRKTAKFWGGQKYFIAVWEKDKDKDKDKD